MSQANVWTNRANAAWMTAWAASNSPAARHYSYDNRLIRIRFWLDRRYYRQPWEAFHANLVLPQPQPKEQPMPATPDNTVAEQAKPEVAFDAAKSIFVRTLRDCDRIVAEHVDTTMGRMLREDIALCLRMLTGEIIIGASHE